MDQHGRQPAVTDLAPSHERAAPSRRRGPGTVLIVDDIVDVRELYAKHFRGAFEAGPDGFLTKPCLPEELETHVRRLLDRLPA